VKQQLVQDYILQGLGPGTGKLEPDRNPYFVGTRFAVDRRSGRVVGSLLDTADAQEIRVLHVGSNTEAFTVITTGHGKAKLLAIRENTEGPEKAFTGVFHPHVIAGTCH